MNGVSKKLCVTLALGAMILQMSDGAENKMPYAIIIGVICIAYKLVQGYLDSRGEK